MLKTISQNWKQNNISSEISEIFSQNWKLAEKQFLEVLNIIDVSDDKQNCA
jgi:hypothetical protein